MLCRVLKVNRSSFYKRATGKTEKEPILDEELAGEIWKVITNPRYIGYGYRRTWAVLKFNRGIKVGKKKVQRIMRIKGWQAKPIKRPKRYGGESYTRQGTVVNPREKISVAYPDLRWSTDLTKFYVVEEGWVNLIPVMDCCTRECIGWRLSRRGRALEAREALEAAVVNRFGSVQGVPADLVLRTDNGSIFLSHEYWAELKRLGIEPEYTPYRCPSANGISERFMKTIKEECVWQHRFETLEEAEVVIANWIEFYNKERRHSSLGYMSPAQRRKSLRKSAA